MRPAGSPEELERRRERAIGLLQDGYAPVEVAQRVGVARRSVRRWKAAFRKRGEKGIQAQRASGRPPKLDAQQLQVAQGVRQHPIGLLPALAPFGLELQQRRDRREEILQVVEHAGRNPAEQIKALVGEETVQSQRQMLRQHRQADSLGERVGPLARLLAECQEADQRFARDQGQGRALPPASELLTGGFERGSRRRFRGAAFELDPAGCAGAKQPGDRAIGRQARRRRRAFRCALAQHERPGCRVEDEDRVTGGAQSRRQQSPQFVQHAAGSRVPRQALDEPLDFASQGCIAVGGRPGQ